MLLCSAPGTSPTVQRLHKDGAFIQPPNPTGVSEYTLSMSNNNLKLRKHELILTTGLSTLRSAGLRVRGGAQRRQSASWCRMPCSPRTCRARGWLLRRSWCRRATSSAVSCAATLTPRTAQLAPRCATSWTGPAAVPNGQDLFGAGSGRFSGHATHPGGIPATLRV